MSTESDSPADIETTLQALSTMERQLRCLKIAIAPDTQSKAAYIGRVMQTESVTIISDDGTSFEKDVSFPISWNSILKILDLINKRAET